MHLRGSDGSRAYVLTDLLYTSRHDAEEMVGYEDEDWPDEYDHVPSTFHTNVRLSGRN